MDNSIRDAYRGAGWMRSARCAGTAHPEWWSSVEPSEIAKAVATCGECPVKGACLAFALDTHVAGSVWGGATPAQRHRLRRPRPEGARGPR